MVRSFSARLAGMPATSSPALHLSTPLMPARDAILRRNNVRVSGNERGPAMIFAHGFGCDQNMWRFIVPAFAPAHRIVLFDYVGSGRSDLNAFQPDRYGKLDGYAEDLLEVCEALALEQAILVAHSVSAMIGLLASIQQPSRFSRLIMVAPSPRYINDPPYVGGLERTDVEGLLSLMEHNYIGWASMLAPLVMGNPGQPELAGELERSFCSTDPVAANTFAHATFFADNRADLPRVGIPALILQVKEDAIAPMEVGRYMHARMPGSTLSVIDATGHCPHMSHPELTIRAMQEFLEPERVGR
jgi:sigma-B regulation protein RsbQ